MAALPPRSSTRAGAKLSSPPPPPPGHAAIVILVVTPQTEHVIVDIPVAARPSPPEHVAVDTTKKPARASRTPRAEHVAVDVPAAANNTEPAAARPSSRLVRALAMGVSAASLLGMPAMLVAAAVTRRVSPFAQILWISSVVLILGVLFLLREKEKDEQLQEQMDRS